MTKSSSFAKKCSLCYRLKSGPIIVIFTYGMNANQRQFFGKAEVILAISTGVKESELPKIIKIY